jgi:hypothetical protein
MVAVKDSSFSRTELSLIGFFTVFHSIYPDAIALQCEKNAMRSDAQTIAIAASFEFEDIPLEIIAKLVHSKSDIPPDLFRKSAKLLKGFLAYFQAIAHTSKALIC